MPTPEDSSIASSDTATASSATGNAPRTDIELSILRSGGTIASSTATVTEQPARTEVPIAARGGAGQEELDRNIETLRRTIAEGPNEAECTCGCTGNCLRYPVKGFRH